MGNPWSSAEESMAAERSLIVMYRCALCSMRYARERVVNSVKAEIQLGPSLADTHTFVDFEDDGCLRETGYIPKFEPHDCAGPDEGKGVAYYCGYYRARTVPHEDE